MFRTIPRCITIAAVATGCVAAQTLLATSSQAGPHVAADPAVITTWNGITARTLAENGVPIPTSGLYYGFVAIAVYDAVVTIEGGYEPYSAQPRAHANASSEVAAVTAAYRVLSHYFPASAGKLAVDYETSVSVRPRPPRSSRLDRMMVVARPRRRLWLSRRACGVRRPTPSPRCSCPGSASSGRWS